MASVIVTPLGCGLSRPTPCCPGLHSVGRSQRFAIGRTSVCPVVDVDSAAVHGGAGPAPLRRASVRVVATTAAAAAPIAASCKSCCGAGGAGAASASAGVLGLSAGVLFGASSALMVPVYALMAFFPSLKLTRSLLLNSSALYVGLALLYCATLAGAWQAGLGSALADVVASLRSAALAHTAWASLDLSPLAKMFVQPLVTLLSWLHLLALDALMAREVALDGLRTGTPTAHSVLLCFFFGPTGLLSHAVTRVLLRGRASS